MDTYPNRGLVTDAQPVALSEPTTAPSPVVAHLTEMVRRVHLQREQLERQQRTPGTADYLVAHLTIQISDAYAVERALLAEVRDLTKAGAR